MLRICKDSALRVGAVAFAAALVGTAAMGTPAAAQNKKVSLGYQVSLWGAPAVVALKTGLFEKHGLDVDAKVFSAGKDSLAGVISGGIDVSTVGGTPFVVGATTGQIISIGVVAYNGKTGCIMAAKELNATKLADLKGKKIGSKPGSSIDTIFINKVMPAFGMKPSDFQMVNVNFGDHVAALASHSVDAIASVEPFCTIAETEGLATKVVDYYKYDSLPNMWVTTNSWVDNNFDTAVAFMAAMLEANEMFEKQPEKVGAILEELYKERHLKPEAVDKLVKAPVVDADYAEGLNQYFQEQVDALKAAGKVKTADVDWNKVLRKDVLEAAKKKIQAQN